MASEISQQGDLDWLAFQYAAGELQGADRDAFELRLTAELPACEALAKAVLLCQAVAVCEAGLAIDKVSVGLAIQSSLEPTEVQDYARAIRRESLAAIRLGFADSATCRSGENTSGKPQSGRRPVAWHVVALVGSAACLALMASWMAPGQPNSSGLQTADLQAGLVSMWIDGAAIEDAESSHPVVLPQSHDLADGAGDSAVVLKSSGPVVNSAQLESDDGDAVPGWMLAAVAERQREVGAMDDEVIQD